jgi:hypothetical protein
MKRMEIVVPRASWSDVFSDNAENQFIPRVLRPMKPEKGPAAMHLQRPSLLSKEWGEVHFTKYQLFLSPLNSLLPL